eukprot:COSAG06_NODE_19716_length_824_cov_1.780992_1_plen_38_part_10
MIWLVQLQRDDGTIVGRTAQDTQGVVTIDPFTITDVGA